MKKIGVEDLFFGELFYLLGDYFFKNYLGDKDIVLPNT